MNLTPSTGKPNTSTNAAVTVRQDFFFTAPAASTVLLVGDFTHWQKSPFPLRKGRPGVWQTSVVLAPGTYHYRFIVDGEWQDDPDCTMRVPNPYGQHNSVLVVPALRRKGERQSNDTKPAD